MAEPKRILVVDDDPQLQRLMQLTLKRQGYDVILASSGEEAISQVIAKKPDLILMDVMMPDMDGFEATKRIRRLPEGRNIPVIFLSALTQVDAKIKGLRVGGSDYVTKPVNIPELLARIEAHLRTQTPPLGKLFTVMGSKAGIGTTSFVVNLALAMHALEPNQRVLIVDWRRPLGDVALFLGLIEPKTVDVLLPVIRDVDEEMLEQVLTEYTPGIKVLAGSTDPGSRERMNLEAMSQILEVALTLADYVLVDTGDFFTWSDPPLVSKDVGINICLVTPELTSVKRALQALIEVSDEEYDFWFILNRENMPGGVATRQIESHLSTILMGKVPDEPDIVTRALNMGRPVYQSAPKSRYSKAIRDIARRLITG